MARKKKRRRWILWILLAVILIVILGMYLKKKSEPKGVEIVLDNVEKRTIHETVSASGRIFPETEIKITSDVSGEIVELYVTEGDSVRAGQVLVKIDPDAYVSAVERGKATVSSAKAQTSISKSQIESSIAQKEQILAQLSNAKRIHERNVTLHKDGVISDVEKEQSASNLESLEANLRAAEASIRSSKQSAEGAEFNVQSAEATLKELKTSLNRTTIKAPVSGIVSSLSVEQGERVVGTMQMSGTEIMRISNLNAMEVQVDVSENDIVKVNMGDSVSIEVDAYLEKKFKGKITAIANSASNLSSALGASINTDQVTNFPVKIRILAESYQDLVSPTRPYPFRPGMSASVDIFTDVASNVITVPIQAVTTRVKEETEDSTVEEFDEVVFVFEADTVRSIKVVSGIQDDEYIQIIDGLSVNQEIVSGPYSAVSKKLDSGTEARIQEEDDDKKNKKRKRG